MAAKKTKKIIPLCHTINLSGIEIEFKINEKKFLINVVSKVTTNFSTGVEMEALVACSVASLTIYDMCKSIDKKIVVTDLKLDYKSGGKSGIFSNDKF